MASRRKKNAIPRALRPLREALIAAAFSVLDTLSGIPKQECLFISDSLLVSPAFMVRLLGGQDPPA